LQIFRDSLNTFLGKEIETKQNFMSTHDKILVVLSSTFQHFAFWKTLMLDQ